LDCKSEVLEAVDEPVDLLFCAPFVEVIGAEVVIEGAVGQHGVDYSQDRGGESGDRLFGAAACAQAVKH